MCRSGTARGRPQRTTARHPPRELSRADSPSSVSGGVPRAPQTQPPRSRAGRADATTRGPGPLPRILPVSARHLQTRASANPSPKGPETLTPRRPARNTAPPWCARSEPNIRVPRSNSLVHRGRMSPRGRTSRAAYRGATRGLASDLRRSAGDLLLPRHRHPRESPRARRGRSGAQDAERAHAPVCPPLRPLAPTAHDAHRVVSTPGGATSGELGASPG